MIDGISVGRDPRWFDMSGQGAALSQLMQMNQQLMQQLAHDRDSKLSGRDGDCLHSKKQKIVLALFFAVSTSFTCYVVGICFNSF